MTTEQWEELKAQVEAHGPTKVCFYNEEGNEIYVEDIAWNGDEIEVITSE